jgi:DNA polymerase-3 subunit delta
MKSSANASASSNDLEPVLAAIKAGKAKPVYVVVGEEFLARKAAEEIVEQLVPKAMAGLNVTVMDAPSPLEVARDLGTFGMFRTAKVVWVREPEFLLPKKGRADALSRAREAWLANRRKDAARRVLGLAARAGWGLDELDPASPRAASADDWKSELDIELADADLTFLGEVARFCREEKLSAPESDAHALEELLTKGLPSGHHLVIEASSIDSRSGLSKRLIDAGELIERKVERELRKLDIHELVDEVLRPLKKKLSRDAETLLKSLVGGNMRLIQSELEKLALYVGERNAIEADDVRLLVTRTRDEEYFELADALQHRNLPAALRYAAEALGQGANALQILGGVAGVLRRLLEDKERYLRLNLSSRLNYKDFQEVVYPGLVGDAKASGKKPPHVYACFLGWQAQSRFERNELVEALLAAGECDLELKSSSPPRLALEKLLFRLCQPA